MRFWCLLVLPLLFQSTLAGQRAAQPNGPAVYPLILQSGFYRYFPVDTFANLTAVEYSLEGNTSVTTAFMTDSQFQDFSGNDGPVSNSVAYQNSSSTGRVLHVGPGRYDVLIYAYGGNANATLSLSVFPDNPFADGPLAAPEPSGIASFGLTNSSGEDSPYAVASTAVVGLASIRAMSAYNGSAGSVGSNPSGATLQLNAVLVVAESGGGNQVYWCQNTPDFVTAASQVALADNVWNYSVSGFLSNDSVTSEGGGYVSTFLQDGTTQYYYAFGEKNSTYSLPLGLILFMNATAKPGLGVLVQFGARATGGVLGGRTGSDWFDNVTIHDPAVAKSYFLTAGNFSTPLATFYDSELVFGGEGNGEATSFSQLSASLGLYNANGSGSGMTAFPSYFSFGLDTAEASDNLRMRYLGDGAVSVSVGTPNYEYMGSATGAFSLPAVESSLGFPSNSTSVASTSPTDTSTSSAPSSTNGAPNSIPGFPYQGAVAAVFTALLAASYLAFRRRMGAQAP